MDTSEAIKAANLTACRPQTDVDRILMSGYSHITEMYHMVPGTVLRCLLGDVYVRVTIKATEMDHPDGNGWSIWDQVYIADGNAEDSVRGHWCGNRHGGRNMMVVILDAAMDRIKAGKTLELQGKV